MLFVALVGADSAHAQLRSLAAMKYLALEGSPGAERQTQALRTHKMFRYRQSLMVSTLDRVPAQDHPYFARCVVRTNLPKPLSIGLECYDAVGAYVGTKQAANVDQLAYEVWRAVTYGSPSARPLHSYRYIYVEPFHDRYGRFDLLVNELRQAAVFTVINQHEALFMPEPERDLILRCSLDHIEIYDPPWVVGKTVSSLLLFNVDNDKVAAVRGEGKWVAFVTTEAEVRRKILESAVQDLIRARRQDEVDYAPRSPSPVEVR